MMQRSSRLTVAVLLALAGSGLSGCDMFVSAGTRVERARASSEQGNFRGATIELRKALEDEPGNAQARVMLASAFLELGDPQAAMTELDRAQAAGAKPEEVAPHLARALLYLGRGAEVLERIESGKLPLTGSALAQTRGRALLSLGRVEDAGAAFREALAAEPNSLDAGIGLIEVMVASGDVRSALSASEDLISRHPDSARARIVAGTLLLRDGRSAEAEKRFAEALASKSRIDMISRVTALAAMTEAQLARGAMDAAARTLSTLKSVGGNSPSVALLEAQLLLAQQQYAKASVHLQRFIAAQPNSLSARLLLGIALLADGNVEQAEFQLAKVVTEAPENIEARKYLARARLQQSRPDAAVQVLAPILDTESSDPQVEALLRVAGERAGSSAVSLELLEKRVAAAPEDSRAVLALAGAYLAARQPDRALELLKSSPAQKGDVASRTALLVRAIGAQKGSAAAVDEIERLVRENPREPRLLQLAAALYLSTRDYPKARRMLEQAIQIDPRATEPYLVLVDAHAAEGDLVSAKRVLADAIKADPDNARLRLALAKIQWRAGEKDEARQVLEQLRGDNAASEASLLLARIYYAERDAKRGDEIISAAALAAPRNAVMQASIGALLVDVGRYDSAFTHFKTAAELEPGVLAYWLNLARVQIALERWPEARSSLKRALQVQADAFPAVSLLALLDVREGHKEEALNAVAQFRKRHPDDVPGAMLEGDVRARLGQHSEAAVAYAEAVRLQPNFAAVARQVESLRLAGTNNPEAPLVEWLSSRQGDTRARAMLAQTYVGTGRRAQAIEQYERVAKEQPSVLALNNLAWLYYEARDPRAEPTARKAHAIAQGNASVTDTLGWILVESGKTQEGANLLREATEKEPDQRSIRYHYAVALAKLGRRDDARAELDQALKSGAPFAELRDAERLRAELIR